MGNAGTLKSDFTLPNKPVVDCMWIAGKAHQSIAGESK